MQVHLGRLKKKKKEEEEFEAPKRSVWKPPLHGIYSIYSLKEHSKPSSVDTPCNGVNPCTSSSESFFSSAVLLKTFFLTSFPFKYLVPTPVS
jgi:hypothetical protein